MNVILYTREGCHLCDEAEIVLREQGLQPQLVDIDADPALAERYGTCVPVVEIDGKERFRGRVNPHLLRRIVRTQASASSTCASSPTTTPPENKRPMAESGALKGRILETFAVFASDWENTQAKPALVEALGAETTARLQKQFLHTLIIRFGHSSDERVLVFDPPAKHDAFESLINPRWKLAEQGEGSLGERMKAFAESCLAEGRQRVVLVSADCPTLPVAYLRQAFELLRNNAVVLGPAGDGGLYLVGVAGSVPAALADCDPAAEGAFDSLKAALESAHVGLVEMPSLNDIDTPADLQRLAADLNKLSGDSPVLKELEEVVSGSLATLAQS